MLYNIEQDLNALNHPNANGITETFKTLEQSSVELIMVKMAAASPTLPIPPK